MTEPSERERQIGHGMRVGWLVWEYEGDDHPILVPDGHDKLQWCCRKVRIVYAEVIED